MKQTFIILAAALWGWAFLDLGAQAQGLGDKKVLVVHSYHETQEGHVVEMNQGIQEAFAGAGAAMTFFYMDTKQRPEPAWKEKAGRLALATMTRLRPQVVIAMDDNAQSFFVTKAMDLPDAPVFVFGGVNADPREYNYPRPNVTGVLERPNIQESLELLLKIQPGVRTVLMLSDQSRTSDLFVAYAKTLNLPVKVSGYVQVSTQEEWEKTIAAYKDKVDAFGIYLLRTVREKAGASQMVPETRLMEILNANTALPTVGFFDTAAASGVLCGISVSMKEQGYAAGYLARAILEGQSPASFPPAPTRQGRIQLNLVQAERLGLDLKWEIISKADVVVKE